MNEPQIPDLLSLSPMARVDMREIERALGFAFASAGSDVALNEQLSQANLPLSTWDPACFAHDLYLPTLIELLRSVTLHGQPFELNAGHLLRVLSHPPADIQVARFRQHILHELLTVPGAAAAFETLYVKLQTPRAQPRESGLGLRPDANRRSPSPHLSSRGGPVRRPRGLGPFFELSMRACSVASPFSANTRPNACT